MKKFSLWLFSAVSMLTLVSTARADAIVGPLDMSPSTTPSAAPWLLLVALVALTLLLLFRFRNKK